MHVSKAIVFRFIVVILLLFLGINIIAHHRILHGYSSLVLEEALLDYTTLYTKDADEEEEAELGRSRSSLVVDYDNDNRKNGIRDDSLNNDKAKVEVVFNINNADTDTGVATATTIKQQQELCQTSNEEELSPTIQNNQISDNNNNISDNLLTGAWIYPFWAGFCNQYFMFIGIVFISNDLRSKEKMISNEQQSANNKNTSLEYQSNQIYIHGLQWKDLYGTDKLLRHEVLFDVKHWNQFYPKLPKLVFHFDDDENPNNSESDKNMTSTTSSKFTDTFLHYDERRVPESVPTTKADIENHNGLAPRMIWNNTNLALDKTSNYERMIHATNPYPMGHQNPEMAKNQYKLFAKRLYKYQKMLKSAEEERDGNKGRHVQIGPKQKMRMEQYRLILKDAFRPHPELQSIIDNFKASLGNCSTKTSSTTPYMVLHARIEPDMQRHPMCKNKKVTNLTDIIEAIYNEYPTPPTTKMIILLNKQLLQDEVKEVNSNNTMAAYNLKVLDDVLQNGLYRGQTEVIEAGSKLAIESNHEIYSKYSTIVGGIINFFLSIDAEIFIGTEVSSYSTSIVNSRYYRYNDGLLNDNVDYMNKATATKKRKMNYFYHPEGLDTIDELHWFQC